MSKFYQLVYSSEWKKFTKPEQEQMFKDALYDGASPKFIELDKKLRGFIDSVEKAIEDDDEIILKKMTAKFSEITQSQIDENKRLIFGEKVV